MKKIKFKLYIGSIFPQKLPKMGNYDHFFHFTPYWLLFWVNILIFYDDLPKCPTPSLPKSIIPKISSLGQKSNLHKYIGLCFLQKWPKMGYFDHFFHFTLYWWLFLINFLYFRTICQNAPPTPILPKSSKKVYFK